MADEPYYKSNIPIIDLRESWGELSVEQKIKSFDHLTKGEANDFFLALSHSDQAELINALPQSERRLWVRLLPPDDLADVIQRMDSKRKDELLACLDEVTRKEVFALLAYEEDEAGGLMNPRFARVRPDVSVDEAIRYLRKQAEHGLETMRYIYVLDAEQCLLGVVSLRALFVAEGSKPVKEIMRPNTIGASEDMPQEDLQKLFSKSGLNAIPVIDDDGHMKGIVTVDDILGVAEDEATEDIQRLGGTEVLDAPYLKIELWRMIKKRAGWLVVLFVGEMFTATAMKYFELELSKAIVLALFIPLIISSGGNSGSQASTLVVRAIALGEVRLRDWWLVLSRELIVGTALGLILGTIGLLRIFFWAKWWTGTYGPHPFLVALTVALSLQGIVLWGSISGSMLPFLLKKLRLDPATASAPFVATLVDVSGLVIYFIVANIILKGTLL